MYRALNVNLIIDYVVVNGRYVAPDHFPTSGVCVSGLGRSQCCLWREGCLESMLAARVFPALGGTSVRPVGVSVSWSVAFEESRCIYWESRYTTRISINKVCYISEIVCNSRE